MAPFCAISLHRRPPPHARSPKPPLIRLGANDFEFDLIAIHFHYNPYAKHTHTQTCRFIYMHARLINAHTHVPRIKCEIRKQKNNTAIVVVGNSWLAFLAARTFAMREMFSRNCKWAVGRRWAVEDVKVMRDMHARGRSIAGGGVRCQDRP